MAQVDVYNWQGEKSGKMDLPDMLFAAKVSPGVVHEALVAQEGNSRVRIAQTKGRHEVRGGGRKPWKQKGTGRARHGSRRSPIWTGGGVTFGPHATRNFAKKINKRTKRKALCMVLTDKLNGERFVVVDAYDVKESKTSEVSAMRDRMPGKGRKMLVLTTKDDASIAYGARNLDDTIVIGAKNINVRDLLKYEYVLASKQAVEELVSQFSN